MFPCFCPVIRFAAAPAFGCEWHFRDKPELTAFPWPNCSDVAAAAAAAAAAVCRFWSCCVVCP